MTFDEKIDKVTVAIPSGRGIRSGYVPEQGDKGLADMSQSPLVGAFVPAFVKQVSDGRADMSQSPLVGAFVPALYGYYADETSSWSQSPLVGAFVPAHLKSVGE